MSATQSGPDVSLPNRRGWATPWGVTAVAALPLVAHFVAKVLVWPRPHWAYMADPDVMFVYSAIDLADGRPPAHVEHPGLPLLWIGAGVVRLTGSDPLRMDLIRSASYTAAFLLNLGALRVLVGTILRHAAAPIALAAAWTCWICPQMLFRTTVWGPETVYFAFAAVALAALIAALRPGARTRHFVLAGAAVGSCIALKFTFAPWALAMACAVMIASVEPLRVRLRNCAVASGAAAVTFLAWVWPALDRPEDLFGLAWSVVSRRGMYGRGEAGPPTASEGAGNLLGAIRTSATWHVWIAACIALAVLLWRRDSVRGRRMDPLALGLTVFGAVSLVGVYPMIVRTGILRYGMSAGVSLCAILVAAFMDRPDESGQSPVLRRLRLGAALGAGLLMVKGVWHDVVEDHLWWVRSAAEQQSKILGIAQAHVGEARRPFILWSRRSPDPAYSLGLYATTDDQVRRVQEAYPDRGWYNMHRRVIRLPAGVTDWDVAVLYDCDVAGFPEPLGPHLGTVWAFQVYARRRP